MHGAPSLDQAAARSPRAWPLLAAASLSIPAAHLRLRAPALPPGDLLHPLAHGIDRLRGTRRRWRLPATAGRLPRLTGFPRGIGDIASSLQLGALWLALLAALTVMLAG